MLNCYVVCFEGKIYVVVLQVWKYIKKKKDEWNWMKTEEKTAMNPSYFNVAKLIIYEQGLAKVFFYIRINLLYFAVHFTLDKMLRPWIKCFQLLNSMQCAMG